MTPQEKLAALPGKWRKTGALLIESQRVAYESCADELTTTLSEHGGGGEPEVVYAVPTDDETWEHHATPPPNCDYEKLYRTPSAPAGAEERVRGIIALLRQPEPDNGEKYTEHDAGYDQASREIADMLERALTPPAAAPRVEEGGEKTCCDRAYKDGYDTGKMHASRQEKGNG